MANKLFTYKNGVPELVVGSAAGQSLQWDGTDWVVVSSSAAAYDIRGKFLGNPASGTVLDSFVAARSTTIDKDDAHQFYCDALPVAGNTVTIQVTQKKISDGTTVNIFAALFTNSGQSRSNNGLYAATSISAQNDVVLAAGDRVAFTYTFSGSATEASFSSPEWTVVGTA